MPYGNFSQWKVSGKHENTTSMNNHRKNPDSRRCLPDSRQLNANNNSGRIVGFTDRLPPTIWRVVGTFVVTTMANRVLDTMVRTAAGGRSRT